MVALDPLKMRVFRSLLAVSCSLTLALSGCGSPTAIPTEPPVVELPAPVLTADLLRSASYTVQRDGSLETYQLTDGKYQSGSDISSPDYISLSLGEIMAFGDLDGDGLEDALVILGENYGGTGTYVSLVAVLNRDGAPVFADSAMIDDRPLVNSLAVVNGEIHLDATIHDVDDARCCPTNLTVQTYRLVSGQLIQTRFISSPGGFEHSITIASPADGAQVSNPAVLTGSFTAGPFENYFVYRIVLPDGVEAGMASFLVETQEMGGPGTFSLQLDLASAGISGPVRIEVFDLSMMDGSLVALASLNLVFP